MNAHVHGLDESLAALFPIDLSGDVVALRAGIDSSLLSSGVMSVAGVSFGYDNARKANAKWERLMKGRTFHMTDLNARRGDFVGISDDEVITIMRGIVEIVNRYASSIVCTSFDAAGISEAFPKLSKENPHDDGGLFGAFRTPYGALLHICMWAMGDIARERSGLNVRQISYVLETGDEGQAGFLRYLNHIMGAVDTHPNYRHFVDQYSLYSVTSMPKQQMQSVLHAADLIAWEWGRQVDRQRNDKPMRASLSAVTDGVKSNADYFGLTLKSDRMFFRHYDVRHANRIAKFYRMAIEAQNDDGLHAALTQWAETRFSEHA